MGRFFDLTTGEVAAGDPTMGLARFPLGLPPGRYRLSRRALRRADGPGDAVRLDSPYLFALDAAHLAAFEEWYHRVGDACSYRVHTIAARLPEFEAAAGAHVGFYWEQEVTGQGRERAYALDPAGVEPDR